MVVAVFDSCIEGLPRVDSDEILRYYDARKHVVLGLSISGQLWKDEHVDKFEKIVRSGSASSSSQRTGIDICLQRLSLSNNCLTSDCGDYLAGILEVVDTLRELDLSDNRVEAEGLKKLARALTADNCTLRSLNLFNNHLGSACAKIIATILNKNRSIVSLNLGKNQLKSKQGVDKLADALASNKYLQQLCLSHNKFGDARVRHLAFILDPTLSFCPLRDLDLSYNSLTEAGVQDVLGACLEGGNTRLEKLNLSNNNIGYGGVEACAKFLQYSHTIQELVLSSCHVGDEGVGLLCEGLRCDEYCASSLLRLDLGWNCIHDEGAIQLAALLETDDTLQILTLDCNGISDAGAGALAVALRTNMSLQELHLRGNQIRDLGACKLAECVCSDEYSLATLKWEDNRHMTDFGRLRLEGAFRFRQAKKGWLAGVLKNIETRPHMPSINVKVGDEEMICICRHLETYRPFLPLVTLKSLEGPSAVTCRAVECLARTVIAQNAIPLKRLYLHNTRMGDIGAAAIAQSLVHNTNLTVLSLISCGITNQGATFLSNIIRRNCILERLDLKKNRIGDRGARDLFNAICDPVHPTMVSLNLSQNLLTDLCLCGLLSFEPLQQVLLGENMITDRGALDLAKICMNSPHLERLHVPANHMTTKGLQAIGLFLPEGYICFESGNQQPLNGSSRTTTT